MPSSLPKTRSLPPLRPRFLLILLSALLIVSGLAAALFLRWTGGAFAAGSNLVTNPGFESGDLSGWSCDPGDTVVTAPVHSGHYALQMNPTASTTGQCTQTISVQPNSSYTLSAYVDGPYAYLGINGGASNWTSSSSYTQLSVSFTTGASTTSVTIYVHGWYLQGSVYVDDVSLSGPAGSATATPSPTVASSPT
ncbi:MAG: carbohydrate binding domain-containing protein, partial [Thermogemmatispora sp.]|uniref:carbohydrate binding domain-containing protein n=1 Tax=Thermogemmatispora sp. TaxID=1968838 RepID=UPI0026274A4E